MTISSVNIKNYKSFENASFDINPITVFVGTNSSGKSSLMQIILLFAQSFRTNKSRNKALQLYGKFLELGEPENVFFNKLTDRELEFSFDLREPIKLSVLARQLKARLVGVTRRLLRNYHSTLDELMDPEDSQSRIEIRRLMRLQRSYRIEYSQEEEIEKNLAILKKLKKIISSMELTTANELGEEFGFPDLKELENFDLNGIKSIVERVSEIAELSYIDNVVYRFAYDDKNESIKITSISVMSDNKCLLEMKYNTRGSQESVSFESELININVLNKNKKNIVETVKIKGLRFFIEDKLINVNSSIGERFMVRSPSSYLVYSLFFSAVQEVSKSFISNRIRHVSPIRAYPKRYYMVNDLQENDHWNTFDSDKLAAIIKSKPEIKNDINYWLDRLGISIDVEKLNHLIHSIKVEQNGLSLDLTDVGFGVSQILPVIIQPIIASDDSITIIEQPEIHIHPKAQADLADFFISIIESTSKRLIIETHSEAFLKRLRRRMAENTKNIEGSIPASKVAIHYVDKRVENGEGSLIRKIDISSSGAFDWPDEFSEIEIDDTIGFIKYQEQ